MYPIVFSGNWLQTISALISVLRYYMGWKTSKNKVYSSPVLVISSILTVATLGSITVIITVHSFPYSVGKHCQIENKQEFPISKVSIFLGIWLFFETIIGISADIAMIRLLHKMKKIQGKLSKSCCF